MKAPNLFPPEQYDKLISEKSNGFVGVPDGLNSVIIEHNDIPVAMYVPNAELVEFIGDGSMANPFVSYLANNSILTPEQFRHVDAGKSFSNVTVTEFGLGGFIWGTLMGGYLGYKLGRSRKQKKDVFQKEREAVEFARKKGKEFKNRRNAKKVNTQNMASGGRAGKSKIITEVGTYADKSTANRIAKEQNQFWKTMNPNLVAKVVGTKVVVEKLMKRGGKADKVDRPFKVRFHLGAGKNFMTWRLENTDTKEVQFIDPEENRLVMSNCRLTNRPTTAKKIFSGQINKQPIAWIECENVDIFNDTEIPVAVDQIRYNPRENIHWSNNNSKNIDGMTFPELITYGRSVFIQDNGKFYELGGVIYNHDSNVAYDSISTEPFDSLADKLQFGGAVRDVYFVEGGNTPQGMRKALENEEFEYYLDFDEYEDSAYMIRKSDGQQFYGYMPMTSMYNDILTGNFYWVSDEMKYNVEQILEESNVMKRGGKVSKDQVFYDLVDQLIQDQNLSEQTAEREAYDQLGYYPKFSRETSLKSGGSLKEVINIVSAREWATFDAVGEQGFRTSESIDPKEAFAESKNRVLWFDKYGNSYSWEYLQELVASNQYSVEIEGEKIGFDHNGNPYFPNSKNEKFFFGGKVKGAVEYTFKNDFGATTSVLISPLKDSKFRVQTEVKQYSKQHRKAIHKESKDFWLPAEEVAMLKSHVKLKKAVQKKY